MTSPTESQRRRASDIICDAMTASAYRGTPCSLPIQTIQILADLIATALAEEARQVTVCDCHTWPTVGEMHDYVERLEAKYRQVWQQAAHAQREVDIEWYKDTFLEGHGCTCSTVGTEPCEHRMKDCQECNKIEAIRYEPLVTEGEQG